MTLEHLAARLEALESRAAIELHILTPLVNWKPVAGSEAFERT
jgi:hypothetical protein